MIIILILIVLLILHWCITSNENFQSQEIKINSYQDCDKCCYESDSKCWYYDKNNQKKYCECQNQQIKTQNDCIKCCNEKAAHKCYRYAYIKDNIRQIYCDCPRFMKN